MKNKNSGSQISDTFVKIALLLIGIGLFIAAIFGVDLSELPILLPGTEPQRTPVVSEPVVSEPVVSEPAGPVPVTVPQGAVPATLIRTVDGDTAELLVQGQTETVRYVGIDTPERGEPGYRAAQEANRRLLGSGDLYLVPDRTDRDRYGRMLRFIYTAEGVFVNREMVAQGYAQPIEYRPDVTLADDFRQVASEAARARLGFWGGTGEPDGAMSYALTREQTPLHEAAGTDKAVKAQVPADISMTVYGRDRSGRWLQVRLPDRSGGWVQTNKVFLNVPLDQIKVTSESGSVEPAPTVVPTRPSVPGATEIDGITLRVVENTGSAEVVELRNTGRQTVAVSGWELSGSIGPQVCVIPDGVRLSPGQRYQVVSGRSEVTAEGFKCTGAFLWNNTGETIYLRAADGRQIEIDSVELGP
jgi:endonuclease YncB( thermonuclease family)